MKSTSSGNAPHDLPPMTQPTTHDRFAGDARLARIAQAIFLVMLALFSAADAVSAVRLWNLDASALTVHEVEGWIDYSVLGKARKPVIRVSTAEGGVVPLTCPTRAFSRYRVCPPGTPAWSGRKVRIAWVEIPTGWSGEVEHRALRIRAGDELLFEARPGDVVRADLSANFFGMLVGLAVFCPILLFFHAIERLSRRTFSESESRIAAARQRHAMDRH